MYCWQLAWLVKDWKEETVWLRCDGVLQQVPLEVYLAELAGKSDGTLAATGRAKPYPKFDSKEEANAYYQAFNRAVKEACDAGRASACAPAGLVSLWAAPTVLTVL